MSTITAQDIATADLLSALPIGALEELAAGAQINKYHGGQVIFREGEPGDSLHIVRKGLIKILHIADKDWPRIRYEYEHTDKPTPEICRANSTFGWVRN